MDIFDPQLNFSPEKPFYPMVISYISQVYGIHYLISHGFYLRFENFCKKMENIGYSKDEQILRYSHSCGEENRKAIEKVIRSGKMEFFVTPALASKTSNDIRINKETLAEEIFKDPNTAIQYFNHISAGGLLILAWENTRDDHTDDPLWKFLYHCRNAAAHKGFFNFQNGEPKKVAKWKSLEITSSLQGYPLFPVDPKKDSHDPPKESFLKIGDVLYLLADIEKKFYK